ncbi:MAG: efflux RND transporter periplasmic adaptor subunit [Bryobacterales bacterium]|nr:efflux RND transporter periplasmic adaptor subunit [Bryobacterales bacterium]
MYITGSESTNQGAAEQARRTFRWCGIVVVAAALTAAGCSAGGTASADSKGGKGGGKKKGDMAAPVTVARVVQRDVPVEVQVIGNVEAYSTIAVRSQVGGELTKVSFREGDYIRKGDLLFSVDRRQLEAQLSQAEANYAKAKASLGQTQANLARDTAQQQYLQSQAERFARLVKEGVLSKDQGEQAFSSAAAMQETINADGAAIESAKADIAATKAAAENLRVQLTYTEIRSPINGRTGNLMVKQGNLVAANSVDLVTINQIQPIYVTFAVPEQQLKSVKTYMAQGKLLVSATPQDDPSGKETGYLTFVDNTVDQTTGTIKLKGTFQNEDMKLWPGQFVRVVLRLTTQPNAIVVPNQAVQSGQDGSYVYVVKQNSTVEVRPVTTGARVEEDLVIEDGLQAGETVVTEGQLRLSPGVRVRIRPGGADGGRQKAGDD